MARVFAHHTGGVARRWQFDLFEPGVDLFLRELHGQRSFGDIEGDYVSVLHRADRATLDGFRCDMAGHQAVGGAGEAAVGKQRDESPRPAPTMAAVTPSISLIPGPPEGPSYRMTTTSPDLI